MSLPIAEEAIAVLHDLAQRGEINPWDVQVIDVIDRYLSKLTLEPNSEQVLDSSHLPQSGQAFVWASLLVLLKANTLEQQAQDEDSDELDAAEFELPLLETPELPPRLEYHIRRRPTVPPVRRRRVTLNELIQQIQQMARVMETQLPRQRKRRGGYSRREATAQIAQLAHDENLNETAEQLEHLLRDRLPTLSDQTGPISLQQLVQWWAESHAESPSTHDRVGVFWALLLLCSQSKVDLSQAEFYQDLQITPLISPMDT